MEMIKHNITIRLTGEQLEVLRTNAEKEHRPVANLICKIIKDYIESQNGGSETVTTSPGCNPGLERR